MLTNLVEQARELIADSLFSNVTGLGTARDKRLSVGVRDDAPLTELDLSALFDNEPLARRVVEAFPMEATREPFRFRSKCNPEAAEEAAALATPAFLDALQDGLVFSLLHGGGILWAVQEGDTSPLAGPPPTGLPIRRWQYIERWRVSEIVWDLWGEPLSYRCQPADGAGTVTLHRDRVLRLPGARTSPRKRRQLQGWELSALQAAWATLRDAGASFAALHVALQALSQTVYSVEGLRENSASAMRENTLERIARVEVSRSTHRPVVIDAKDGFQAAPSPIQGLGDAFDRVLYLLSQATGIPVAILFGMSAAGMNATGDADFRAWYDRVGAYQRKTLAPILVQAARLHAVASGKDLPPTDLEVCFDSLWKPTAAEAVTIYGTQATADQTYVAMGALDPEEVRESRFGHPDAAHRVGITLQDRDLEEAEAMARDVVGAGGEG